MTLSLEEMKANRRKWVEALRSGKYEQGKGCLKRGTLYCCLGVLTEVAGAPFDDFGEGGGFESKAARDFVGLANTGGSFAGDCKNSSLWSMNDDGIPFKQIAALIESEPPGLFIDSTPTGSAS